MTNDKQYRRLFKILDDLDNEIQKLGSRSDWGLTLQSPSDGYIRTTTIVLLRGIDGVRNVITKAIDLRP